MRFPAHFLDEIRSRIPISDVVGTRVAWDKRKSQPQRGDYWACCPFHGEKTPSFHADNRRGRYHCFGCGVSGDHFTFLVEQDGLSFPEAVERLAGDAGLQLPDRDPDAEKREAQRATLYDVMEAAAQFFQAQLQDAGGAEARAYLRGRGLTPEIQKRFRIGYAPAGRNVLKSWLAARKIDHGQMVESGLLVAGEDIPVSYDRFRDRVIFPISDLRGRIIAFGGRALSADVPAKYLNSPDTPLFHKGQVLFNGQMARAASRKGGPVIAVEGYTDAIACVVAGFEATVAPLGTALTEDQLRLLWQMSDEPILCFDGDAAGMKAAFRAVDLALPELKPGKSLNFAILPAGADPDDMIRNEGKAAFADVIARPRGLFDMLWTRETQGQSAETPERRAGIEAELRRAVKMIGDASVRRHYETALRERTEAVFGQPGPRRKGGGRDGGRDYARGSQHVAPSQSLLSNRLVRNRAEGPGLADAILIGCLVCHPEIAPERLERLADAELLHPDLVRLTETMALVLADAPDIGFGDLRSALEKAGQGKVLLSVFDKLRQSGLGNIGPGGDAERAAMIWDDAVHLRFATASLSSDRQAAADALGRETDECHLARLRDIQDQEQRRFLTDRDEELDTASVVHPFKEQLR